MPYPKQIIEIKKIITHATLTEKARDKITDTVVRIKEIQIYNMP